MPWKSTCVPFYIINCFKIIYVNISHMQSEFVYTMFIWDSIYTERQKRLITSSERRSLKSTASKLITFWHRYGLVLLMKHIWKIKRLLLPKRRKTRWYRNRSLFINHRNISLKTSTKGRLFRTFNSYSFNFKGGLCNCRTGYFPYRALCPGDEQFLWFFSKMTFCDFTLFYSFLTKANIHVILLDVLGKEFYS